MNGFKGSFLVKSKYFLMNPADGATESKHCYCCKRIDSSVDDQAPEEESLQGLKQLNIQNDLLKN